MNISLGSLARGAGNLAGRVYNNVNNDVVKPIQRDVIRPVQQARAPLRRLDQTANTYATNFAKGVGTGLVNLGQVPAANIYAHFNPNNAWAQQQARDINTKAQGLTAPILRTVPEAIATITHPLSQFTYHPNNKVEQVLFGKTPVQNIQKKVANNYNTHPNLPTWKRVGLSGLEAAGSVIQDAPVVGTAGKIAKAGEASLAARGIELNAGRLGMSTKDVSLKPRPGPAPVPSEADQLIQQVAHEYKGTDHFIADTAGGAYQLDKSLKGGIQNRIPQAYGQDKMFRTSEHTPFYRDFYAKNGKAPALKDYHAAVTKEFKTGRPNVASQGEHAVYQALHDRHVNDTARALQGPNPLPGALTHLDTPQIIDARKQAAQMPHTMDINTPERTALREQLAAEHYGAGAANKNKRLDLVIGPPAAGKSSNLVDPLAKKYGSIVLDSDAIKEKLPEFNNGIGAGATHKESAHIADYLMSKMAMRNGDNIVAPRLGKNADAIKEYMDLAKKNGYEVHLHSVTLPAGKAAERAVSRFNETGRFVDPHYILSDVANKPEMVYNQVKNEAKTYGKHSTDVQKGESAKLLEQSPGYEQPLGSGRAQHQPGQPGDARAISGKTSRSQAQKDLKSTQTPKAKAPGSKAPISNGGQKPPTKAGLPAKTGPAPGEKLSRFANKTVQKSPEVSAPLKKLVAQEKTGYLATTNKSRLAAADEWMKGKSNDQAFTESIQAFERPAATSSQDVVNAVVLAKKLDASGKESDLFKATEIYDTVSRHLSERGQEVQAASLLNSRTPQGLYYSAVKTLRKGGVDVTPQIQKDLKGLTDALKKSKLGSDERNYQVQTLQHYVAKQIPASKLDKLISTWKAGLLTGVKTITGNAVSNTTFRVGHEISKPLAVALDKTAALVTGKRSQGLTYRGSVSGAGEGFAKGWKYFKTGVDERRDIGNKYLEGQREVNFKNKILNTYVNGVFRNMAAQDRPFYYSQMRTSLNELATVAGKNKGLSGSDLSAFRKETMKSPTMEMMQKAKSEADKSVLAHDTALSGMFGALRKGIDQLPSGSSRALLKTAVETTVPFTRVPAAFVSRVVDFTPIGPLKQAADRIIFKKAISQRDLTTALSEATTGTAVMWLGAKFAEHHLLSGPYPNDPKEQARWKAEGITANSIKIGGKWISLNYLGPSGMLFNAGARAYEAGQSGAGAAGKVAAVAGGVPKDLTQQSFLQGLSNAVSAVNDPGRYLGNYVNQQTGSTIPTIVNDVGNATDKYVRDRNSPGAAIQARIPGLRQKLPISNDVFGNKLQATSNPADRMFNPLRPSTQRDNPLFSEINRLQQNNVAVTPTPLQKTQTFDGVKTALSDQQRKDLQTAVGQNVQKLWNDAIKSDVYKGLSDDGKKTMLDNIYSKVFEGEKQKFAAGNGLGQYANSFNGKVKSLSADAKNYISGNLDIAKFAKQTGSSSSGSSGGSTVTIANTASPDAKKVLTAYNSMDTAGRKKYFDSAPSNEYQYLQAKYNNDTAGGKLSQVDDARAKYSLGKAQIGSSYDKNIRDLYALNKTELYGILSTDPNGGNLADKILKYGDQLQSAGYGSNKFRDSKGNVSIQPKSRTASTGSGRGRKATMSSTISAAGVLNRKVANAKVKKANFTSKISKSSSILAYKKPAAVKNLNPKVRRLA